MDLKSFLRQDETAAIITKKISILFILLSHLLHFSYTIMSCFIKTCCCFRIVTLLKNFIHVFMFFDEFIVIFQYLVFLILLKLQKIP